MEAGAGRANEATASDDLFEEVFKACTQHQSAPSLEPKLAEAFAEAHEDARDLAASETGLPVATFPAKPPFSCGAAPFRS